MEINPIRTNEDYEAALAEIEQLMEANVEPNTPAGERLELLLVLASAYEDEHYPIPFPDPLEAIEYYMESRNLTRADLEPYIGTRARVYEILNRKRPLTLRMIRNLSEGLGIPAEVLIQPYDLDIPESQINYLLTKAKWTTKNIKPLEYPVKIREDNSLTLWFPTPTPTGKRYHENQPDSLH